MNPISLLINYFKNDINSTYLECKSLHYKCICFNYTSNKYIILPITFNNAIFSIKNSLAMHTIIFKLSIKLLPILKNPYSMSLFHIIFHISFEHFPISVLYLFPIYFLNLLEVVVIEFLYIFRHLIEKFTISIKFIFLPISLIC